MMVSTTTQWSSLYSLYSLHTQPTLKWLFYLTLTFVSSTNKHTFRKIKLQWFKRRQMHVENTHALCIYTENIHIFIQRNTHLYPSTIQSTICTVAAHYTSCKMACGWLITLLASWHHWIKVLNLNSANQNGIWETLWSHFIQLTVIKQTNQEDLKGL